MHHRQHRNTRWRTGAILRLSKSTASGGSKLPFYKPKAALLQTQSCPFTSPKLLFYKPKVALLENRRAAVTSAKHRFYRARRGRAHRRKATMPPPERAFVRQSLENLNRKAKSLQLRKYILTLQGLDCTRPFESKLPCKASLHLPGGALRIAKRRYFEITDNNNETVQTGRQCHGVAGFRDSRRRILLYD